MLTAVMRDLLEVNERARRLETLGVHQRERDHVYFQRAAMVRRAVKHGADVDDLAALLDLPRRRITKLLDPDGRRKSERHRQRKRAGNHGVEDAR